MSTFATEHPWLVVALIAFAGVVLDNSVVNIFRAVATRSGRCAG